jgi:hypothetical protein
MSSAILPSQTLEEILYYLEFQGIFPLSRALVMRWEAMVVAVTYAGPNGENQELLFEPVQASLVDRARTIGPSKLLDAGQWLELSDRYAKKADGTAQDLELAAACMEEALRLGAGDGAFFTERGRTYRATQPPGTFERARLLARLGVYRNMLGDSRPVTDAPAPPPPVLYAPAPELLQRYGLVTREHPGAAPPAQAAGYGQGGYAQAGYGQGGYAQQGSAQAGNGQVPHALPAPRTGGNGAGSGAVIAIGAAVGGFVLLGVVGAVVAFASKAPPPPPPPVVVAPAAAKAPRTTPAAVLDSYAHGSPIYDGEKVRICGTASEVTRGKITLRTTGGPGAATLDLSGTTNGVLDGDALCATCTGRGVGPGIALFDGCTDVAAGTR